MALQSQAWAPATPMPVAESSLYRQRLEVIAEKRRLQEQIRTARRELEEEKLRVQRLKRKSLRERWLMDGATEGPEQPGDPAAQDPQSPEGQAQARIRNLEDSLFTLQSQLQLLQSASTGAQHRPPGRPSWRRQGYRPLSQPIMEAGPAGQADVDKRASLPVGPMGLSPESPSEPREGAPRPVSGAGESPQEANGPCSGPSMPPEQRQSLGTGTVAEGSVVEAKGGDMVEVVWGGLQGPQDCAMGATGPELEARVEQVVLEAIGDRQRPGSPKLPAWVREDRGIVEVVWEGLGGSDHETLEEVGGGDLELQERLGGPGSRDRGPDKQGEPRRDEGSFIWVERVTLSEDWEELLMEGLEGPPETGREAGVEGLPGTDRGGGGEGKVEGPAGAGEKGAEERPGTEKDGGHRPLEGMQKESWASSEPEGTAGEQRESAEQDLGVERNEMEGPLRAERGHREERPGAETEAPLGVDKEGGEERAKEKAEQPLGSETVGEEGSLGAGRGGGEEGGAAGRDDEEPVDVKEKGGKEEPGVTEEPLVTEREGSKEPLVTERKEGEEPLGEEETPGAQDLQNGTEQREAGEGRESQTKAGSEAGLPLEVMQEMAPELQPPEKQEGYLEEEAGVPQPPAEAQGPAGDATPLLAETPAPDQPTESQPLLPWEGPSTNPSAHPAPTYAPARQPEPTSRAEGEEASGPKQKTCQCCAVM